jgi:hypothetical protein
MITSPSAPIRPPFRFWTPHSGNPMPMEERDFASRKNGIQELSSAGDGRARRFAAIEREQHGKKKAIVDMQRALEAGGDPRQLQDLKKAVEDFLFRRF